MNTTTDIQRLGEIRVPTLILVGNEDIITPPSESEVLAKGIPNSRLEVIADAGHFPMLEQPQAFNRVLANFLAQQTN